MKASELKRQLPQYKDLYTIDDKDEFLHCFVYELAIRDISKKLEDEFKTFYIEDNTLCLQEEEIKRLLKEADKEIFDKANQLQGKTAREKSIYYKIYKIEDDLMFDIGLSLVDLHVEYTFLSDHFTKIFYAITDNQQWIRLQKNVYDDCIETETYRTSKYLRTTKKFPKMKNDDFRDIKTHYTLNYKRPMFTNTILSNSKKADITINTDLSKDMIMQQVEKLIDIMKKDSDNIYSNKDKILTADKIRYDRYTNKIFEERLKYVDGLLVFDYLKQRSKEVKIENKKIEEKKRIENEYIKKSKE